MFPDFLNISSLFPNHENFSKQPEMDGVVVEKNIRGFACLFQKLSNVGPHEVKE